MIRSQYTDQVGGESTVFWVIIPTQRVFCSLYSLTLSALQWYTLNDVKSGKVHLILEWVPAVSHPARLDQVRPK